jgi:hypothetical protein
MTIAQKRCGVATFHNRAVAASPSSPSRRRPPGAVPNAEPRGFRHVLFVKQGPIRKLECAIGDNPSEAGTL